MGRTADARWSRESLREVIRRRSFWMEVLGVALIAFGLFALIAVYAASLASVLLIGWMLLASGAAYITATSAFWRMRSGGFALGILLGILCIVAGILCLTRPAQSLVALTFLLGTYFLASGVVRVAVAFSHRLPGWSWAVAMAVVDLILGLLILAWWPVSSAVVPGTLLGLQLIASGIAAVTTGSAIRGLLVPGASAGEPAAGRPATRFQH